MASVQVKVEQPCTLTDGTYLFSFIHRFNLTRRFGNRPVSSCYARIIFQGSPQSLETGDSAGSTESKQLPIELLYWYKWPKTSRITVLSIQELYNGKLSLSEKWCPPVPLKNDAPCNTRKLAYTQQSNPNTSSNSF